MQAEPPLRFRLYPRLQPCDHTSQTTSHLARDWSIASLLSQYDESLLNLYTLMRRGDDEMWRELGHLRRRVAEQEDQIDKQEHIIVALTHQQQQLQGTATPPRSRDGSLEQQLRLAEVRDLR